MELTYYQRNRDKILKRRNEYYRENRIKSKQYYQENKNDIIQRQNEYRQTENYRVALKKYNIKRRLKRKKIKYDKKQNDNEETHEEYIARRRREINENNGLICFI